MPLFAESKEKIYGDIIRELLQSTNLSRSSPGSKTRAIAQSVSRKLGRMWNQFDLNTAQAYLDGAEGQFLDFLGDMMGLPRLGAEPGSVTTSSQNVKFFVTIGTFGDVNGGSSILIPAGTIISTGPEATGTLYRVVANTILLAGQSEAYISAQAVRSGTNSNVGANQLLYHNFVNYIDSANDSLVVTNEASIINAQDTETDTNYRFRIANQVVASEKANATAIRLSALSVPGVADIVLVPFHRGIGSIDLLIKSTVPRIPDSLISVVQTALDSVTSQGIIATARGPNEVGISMVGTLTFRRELTEEEETQVIAAATDNVTEYINTLDIGEEFVLQEIIEQVLSASDIIKQVGTTTKPLDQLFVYRDSRLGDNRLRSTLIENLEPEVDERIIVEDIAAGTTPILFRAA